MLAEIPKNNGGRPTENQSHDTTGFQTLSDIEITRDQSSRWQKLAAVLVRAFEARTDSRARQWFEVTPQPMLTFWCQVVGLDVGTVRKRAHAVWAGVSV
jgi:hypothetical protein